MSSLTTRARQAQAHRASLLAAPRSPLADPPTSAGRLLLMRLLGVALLVALGYALWPAGTTKPLSIQPEPVPARGLAKMQWSYEE